jgi:hypothetical protein
VVGQRRLGPNPVVRVPGVVARRIVLVIAQVLGHLLIQRCFHHGLLGELSQQTVQDRLVVRPVVPQALRCAGQLVLRCDGLPQDTDAWAAGAGNPSMRSSRDSLWPATMYSRDHASRPPVLTSRLNWSAVHPSPVLTPREAEETGPHDSPSCAVCESRLLVDRRDTCDPMTGPSTATRSRPHVNGNASGLPRGLQSPYNSGLTLVQGGCSLQPALGQY